MNENNLSRRNLLRGALAGAVALPFGIALSSCAGGGGGSSSSSSTDGGASAGGGGEKDPTKNPFGLAADSKIEAVVFNGGYGVDYVQFAADILQKNHSGAKVEVVSTTDIAPQLQPRFAQKDVPDLFDNSGAKSIGWNAILPQLADLKDVVESNNLEGTKISDNLYQGVLEPGTFDGSLKALNYVLTVYGVWYSGKLFADNGWEVPKTWDEALALGEKAKAAGKYLFVWGKEAATYYQTFAIDSAIQEGGDEVRLALENLEEGCWSKPAIQGVFTAMKKAVDSGYFKPGGSGTQFTVAQSQWSNSQDVCLYPSGSWIENEMKKDTLAGFEMKGFAGLTLTAKEPALHSEAGEPFAIPSDGKNVAGGKELLRTMLSKDAATNFVKTKLAPTIVKGTVPDDAFGSTALKSQVDMLEAAPSVFTHRFVNLYGMNPDQLVIWNSFLDGGKTVEELTKDLQDITDKVAKDPSITKIKVTK